MYQILFRIPLPDWLRFGLLPEFIPIYGYGTMLFLAFVLCTWMAGRRAQKEGIAKEFIQDLAIWLFVGGLAGARTVYLFHEGVSSVGEFLSRFPRIWDGGIVLYGGVIGGAVGYALAYVFVLRKHGLSTLKLADIIAPAVAVGLCLGRIGCLLNGCCYGHVACSECVAAPIAISFPLSAPPRFNLTKEGLQTAAGFTIDEKKGPVTVDVVEPNSPAARSGLRSGDRIVEAGNREIKKFDDLSDYLNDSQEWRGKRDLSLTVVHADSSHPEQLPAFVPWTLRLYPTQVFESVSMLLLFLLLTAYYPFRRHDGEVMALLMMSYALHRYFNEMLRGDRRPEWFEEYSSIFLFAAGLALLIWLVRRPAQYRPFAAT